MHMYLTDTAKWVPEPTPEFTALECKPVTATNSNCGLWQISEGWYWYSSEQLDLPAVLDHRWNGKNI
jgi:hypothetical protein